MTKPPVSVVMPVHNGLAYLDEAIASILGQTFTDFEFVIGDNGSTDGTSERVRYWAEQDPRIRLLCEPERLGPAGSSNWVVEHARADLLARMDADDVAHPDRLAKQVEAMRKLPQADMIGTLYETIDEAARPMRPPNFWKLDRPSSGPPFCHPTIMFRRAAFDRIGGYRKEADYWEDIDLFWRFADAGPVYVLPEALMTVRHTMTSSRTSEARDLIDHAVDRFYRSLHAYEAGAPAAQLPGPEPAAPDGEPRKLIPMAFVSRAAVALWAGQRPHALRRMLRRADLGFNLRSGIALGKVMAATVAPRTLRAGILLAIRLRNAFARRSGEPVEWRPRGDRQS